MDAFLANSRATEPFKQAVESYSTGARAVDRIQIDGKAPRIKVLRVLKQMLATEPELDIERIRLRAESGCSDFVGVLEVETATGVRAYEFVWDCRWRAEQEGWSDYFGFPDQIRAAQELDWQCFSRWELTRPSIATPVPASAAMARQELPEGGLPVSQLSGAGAIQG